MRRPLALSLALTITAVLSTAASCQKTAPKDLSPAAQTAFTQTRVIQALDLVRDAAIAANEQPVAGCVPSEAVECPPLLTTATTRRIVQYHRSAIIVVHENRAGWRAEVLAGLDEALANLPVGDRSYLAPYAALLRSILQEVMR